MDCYFLDWEGLCLHRQKLHLLLRFVCVSGDGSAQWQFERGMAQCYEAGFVLILTSRLTLGSVQS